MRERAGGEKGVEYGPPISSTMPVNILAVIWKVR